MRVLITNIRLDKRTGTELIVGEVAVGLRDRGHEIVIYSPTIGLEGDRLRRHGFVVVDDVASLLNLRPDVIHGHHNVTTGLAMLACPGVPTAWFCHDMITWHDVPFACAGIQRFVAHSEQIALLLSTTAGIAPQRVVRIENATDISQFDLGNEAPKVIKKAIAFAKYNGRALDELEDACAAMDIRLTRAGAAYGAEISDVAAAMADHDLVIGYGRLALEAIAANRPVLCLEGERMAGLATADVASTWMSRNFGSSILRHQTDRHRIIEEIRLYDPASFSTMRNSMLERISLIRYLDQVESLHRDICAEGAPPPVVVTPQLATMLQKHVHSYSNGRLRPGIVEMAVEEVREEMSTKSKSVFRALAKNFSFIKHDGGLATLGFGEDSAGAYFVDEAGWRSPEGWGRWSLGRDAIIRIPRASCLNMLDKFEICGWIFQEKERPESIATDIHVAFGGQVTTSRWVSEPKANTVAVRIPVSIPQGHVWPVENIEIAIHLDDALKRSATSLGLGLARIEPVGLLAEEGSSTSTTLADF